MTEHSWERYAVIIAIVLIAFGYYGYFYVPQHSTFGKEPFCPFGMEGSSTPYAQHTGPCAYSLISLAIGAIIVIAVIVLAVEHK